MKFEAQTIAEIKDLMFFDNGIEISLRAKKQRITKMIKQSEEFVNDLNRQYAKRSVKYPGAMWHGELYSGKEIKAYENELQELKALRLELYAPVKEVAPTVNFIEFESEIIRETSMCANVDSLGMAKNKMTIAIDSMKIDGEDFTGSITWDVEYLNGEESDEVGIGLWFNAKGELTDYDGVFSLPIQAIQLIEQYGYNADYAKD